MSHDDDVQRTELDESTSIDQAWRGEVRSRLRALRHGDLEMLSQEDAMDVMLRRKDS